MACVLCESLDATTFFNLDETVTLHSSTPIKQFFKRIIGGSLKLRTSANDLFCGSCYDIFNEVDQMEEKIKEIVNDIKGRYKKRIKMKEQIIISSEDHGEIVITVDDDQEYFDFNEDGEVHSSGSPRLENFDDSESKNTTNAFMNNCEVTKENGKIHFKNQHDLKNILNMNIKSEETSESWENCIEEHVIYDMMDDKKVGILFGSKNSSPPKKSNISRSEDKLHKCTRCTLTFPTKQELKSHSTSHVERKPYICEICGKVYRHKSALNIHVGMHNGINPFKCSHCEKSFTQKGAMIRHNKIHTGEKPYQCEECGKCFTHHTSFTIHKISHTGEKSYKCNVCGLMLMSTSHLKRHMRVHTGEKKYTCTTCGKRFAEKYNLMSHSKLHSKETFSTQKRKYRCELCSIVFYKRLHLDEHIKENHSATDEDFIYC
ncbi:zinc finger protein 347-like [Harmonia axyridis]|uniref:zinc finger protein 347-like n=1 Tax=Harmonia axyridis TaxID=115357 RepID=UPI001E27738D|nr:zinc finger protein 347-like [Harmonia axyridis]